jgi:hypothetical protein
VAKTYFDLVKTGRMDIAEAASAQRMRESGRNTMDSMLPPSPKARHEGYAFGILDGLAVRFVQWFGPSGAGEVFRHYAAVCERQTTAARR